MLYRDGISGDLERLFFSELGADPDLPSSALGALAQESPHRLDYVLDGAIDTGDASRMLDVAGIAMQASRRGGDLADRYADLGLGALRLHDYFTGRNDPFDVL
jgi:hypothetical protein